MDSYYSRQAIMPHFTGHARQRGSGFGSLALGVGRVALPFAKKVLPAVQSIGKEFFVQSLPEILEVATKKKAALKKTVKKQVGGVGVEKKETFDENAGYREVGQISSLKLKMLPNVLPVEASHSSLDLFERPPVLITFDTSFEQKVVPLYSPNGPTLEFEVVGDRTNFIDLQNIYLEVNCKILQSDSNRLCFTTGDAAASDLPIFVNNTLHSLFSDCSVSANGIQISSSNGNYAQKAFIETEFSHNGEAKDTWLKCQGYSYEKSPDTFTDVVFTERQNEKTVCSSYIYWQSCS